MAEELSNEDSDVKSSSESVALGNGHAVFADAFDKAGYHRCDCGPFIFASFAMLSYFKRFEVGVGVWSLTFILTDKHS